MIVWSDDSAGAALSGIARRIHPQGVAATLAAVIEEQLGTTASVTIAGLDQADDGLPPRRLEGADVPVWWGHEKHEQVADETVDRVQRRVHEGLCLVALHSAHWSTPFVQAMYERTRADAERTLRREHGDRVEVDYQAVTDTIALPKFRPETA